jgi:integrase/recombinase XerD
MVTTSTSTAVVIVEPVLTHPERLALAGFLGRLSGLTREAYALNRHGAARIVLRVARRAGITKPAGPYTLQHAFITAALDAGLPLRDMPEAASHADPRTMMRYDRARGSLDRHATSVVVAFIAGAAR